MRIPVDYIPRLAEHPYRDVRLEQLTGLTFVWGTPGWDLLVAPNGTLYERTWDDDDRDISSLRVGPNDDFLKRALIAGSKNHPVLATLVEQEALSIPCDQCMRLLHNGVLYPACAHA